jgi:hypothetical protein
MCEDLSCRSYYSHGKERDGMKKWYNYLWIGELLYLALGLVNILFAWLGMIFFVTPLLFAIIGGNKVYCAKYCGRGQLFGLLGGKLKLSRNIVPPKFLRSRWFRYGFLAFFMAMFGLMIFGTYSVFAGADLKHTVTLLWVFRLPWQWAEVSMVSPGIAQFAFGFFGVMLTSTILGLITMLSFRSRSWCVYCPMGTMTQGICKLRNGKESDANGNKG